jgi:1-hydroxycarotenoid 3,4-desaturase
MCKLFWTYLWERVNNPVMAHVQNLSKHSQKIVVVGAGIGGLAAALRLSALGHKVQVIESAPTPGGKIRTLSGTNSPIDLGPTVLTLLSVFERLFRDVGENLHDHISVTQQHLLARHWWRDGTCVDLDANLETSLENIRNVFGEKSAAEFMSYYSDTLTLFECFDEPVMQNANPNLPSMMLAVMKRPSVIGKMRPVSTLAHGLAKQFSDPRLQQLFGRYATYVGGMPQTAPALLSLIWQAEAQGVWTINGGMHELARVIEALCIERGVEFTYNCRVKSITKHQRTATQVILDTNEAIDVDSVVFNGDPRAIALGHLGYEVQKSVPNIAKEERSLSAYVWGFDAKCNRPNLVHHNVFFADTPNSEFRDIAKGKMPSDPTIYVCAQDRGKSLASPEIENFELILNAPPLNQRQPKEEDFERCNEITFKRLEQFGLSFQGKRARQHLTMPQDFEALFPASEGSLYGQSPRGMMATLKRPKCTTKLNNLFLVGGGVHPGAGIPMATLCAELAVAEMTKRQTLT